MKEIIKYLSFSIVFFGFVSCGGSSESKRAKSPSDSDQAVPEMAAEPAVEEVVEPSGPTITDYDGNVYKTVQIGDQLWMAENLNVSHYRNGEEIPNIRDNNIWSGDELGDNEMGAWRYYQNNAENEKNCGKLYNWFAVNDPRGLAPEGWRIPSDEDWTELAMHLGGSDIAGKAMKDRKGFNALYCGWCDSWGESEYRGELGIWWSTARQNYVAWCRIVDRDGPGLERENEDFYLPAGCSVRCIKE